MNADVLHSSPPPLPLEEGVTNHSHKAAKTLSHGRRRYHTATHKRQHERAACPKSKVQSPQSEERFSRDCYTTNCSSIASDFIRFLAISFHVFSTPRAAASSSPTSARSSPSIVALNSGVKYGSRRFTISVGTLACKPPTRT